MSAHVLMVDDDALMRRSLAYTLEQAGYAVTALPSAEEALLAVEERAPDLVLLDIGLPGMDGLDALRRLRQRHDLPVIFVTARRRELEQVLGLELGADDYITKPFDPDVLLARVRAVLRRTRRDLPADTRTDARVSAGDLTVDPATYTATMGGRTLELAPREFELLLALARASDRVVSAEELLAQVWGPGYAGEPQVLYVHVRRLREKIEADPNHPRRLITVRSVGYRLIAQAEQPEQPAQGAQE
jgi:DNA-binding response OmpR family regulator